MVRQVEHYGKVAVLDETGLIERAWQAFAPEALSWFEAIMSQDYHFDFPPPKGEPIPVDWQQLMRLVISRYASAFSVQQVWHQLASLAHGKDLNDYNRRFTELSLR